MGSILAPLNNDFSLHLPFNLAIQKEDFRDPARENQANPIFEYKASTNSYYYILRDYEPLSWWSPLCGIG